MQSVLPGKHTPQLYEIVKSLKDNQQMMSIDKSLKENYILIVKGRQRKNYGDQYG